jgi:prephenate dehydrogenase
MPIGIRVLGLIGGSFEKAFLQTGYDILNLKDATPDKIRSCEIIIVCLPPLMVAPWIRQHANDFADNAIITDAAGVKGVVCDALYELAKNRPGHTLADIPWQGKNVADTKMPQRIFSKVLQ